jgi:hypothetical protein
MSLKILYRLSDKGNPKDKLSGKGMFHCLENALAHFPKEEFVLFADNCEPDTVERLLGYGVEVIQIQLGNAGSWRHVVQYAIENYAEDQAVYLLEDDYLHLEGARQVLLEGLEVGDYVSLYDHPDKYMPAGKGGNPRVRRGGESSRVLRGRSCHWKTTNSTTMTFASKVGTLRKDRAIWWLVTSGKIPKDYYAFRLLCGWLDALGRHRRLVTPLPARSTHVESAWLAPFTDWTGI